MPIPYSRALACLLGLIALQCFAPASVAALEVQIGYAGLREGSAWLGARQGLAEANVQGEFLDQHYTLTPDLSKVSAIVAALTPSELRALVQAHPGIAVLNIASREDALRRDCRPNLLHVMPSDKMLADAVAQWQKVHPGSAVDARAWDPEFEKYAASQLNHRYQVAAGRPMDDAAWAGWAAVKVLSDTIAREQTATAAAVLAALRDKLAFDGQKGVDLSFRANGQLRQPLLLVGAGKLVGEAPVRGATATDNLDTLGAVDCAAP